MSDQAYQTDPAPNDDRDRDCWRSCPPDKPVADTPRRFAAAVLAFVRQFGVHPTRVWMHPYARERLRGDPRWESIAMSPAPFVPAACFDFAYPERPR